MEENVVSKFRNPLEYLKLIFRRKWFFIGSGFAGLVLGICACFIIPPAYESNTLILIEEEKMINPLIQGLAVSTSTATRMQNIREQLLGWNSLVELTKKLNLAKNVKNQFGYEKLILGLRRDIYVKMMGPNLIRISYLGKTPEETRLVTKTLTDILVSENMRTQTQEADLAIEFIKEQLDVYKRKIKESEIADLQEQLKNLLADSTEQHPLVKELRHKLQTAQKEYESGEFQVKKAELSADSPEYKALQKEIDGLINTNATQGASSYTQQPEGGAPYDANAGIYKIMLMDKMDSAKARDKNVNEKIYNMLLEKLETAKITQRLEASKQGTRYNIIDPPRLPLTASKPNKPKVIFLGIFLGLAAGTGLVFGREFLDQSFLDIEDAKLNLQLPVLGGISKITTQEEIDKEKRTKKIAITISIVVSAILLFSVMIIALLRK